MADDLSWNDLLGHGLDGAVRVVVRHDAVTRFRWMVLVELALLLVFLACLLPVWIVASLLIGEPIGFRLDDVGARFTWREHVVRLQLFDAAGRRLHERRLPIRRQEQVDGLLASVLRAADRDRMVVVQQLGAPNHQWVATFYGGRPLLAPPRLPAPDEAIRTLSVQPGLEVRRDADALVLCLPQAERSRVGAVLGLLVAGPVRALSAEGRRRLVDDWMTVRGVDAGVVRLEVRPDGVRWSRERGGRQTGERSMAGGELLGVAYGPVLAAGEDARPRPPRLRLIGRRNTVDLPTELSPDLGGVLAELVIAASLELRARHPALGLRYALEGTTHCGYCGTLYDLGTAERCPSCGAPPVVGAAAID